MQACCDPPEAANLRPVRLRRPEKVEGIRYNGPRHLTTSFTRDGGIIRPHGRLICRGWMPSTTQALRYFTPSQQRESGVIGGKFICYVGYSENSTVGQACSAEAQRTKLPRARGYLWG